MHEKINDLLNAIVRQRENEGHPVSTKQGVIAELVINQHKKECKS